MRPNASDRRATPGAVPASLPGAALHRTAAHPANPCAPIPPATTRTEAA